MKVDLPSVALSLVAVLSSIYALKEIARDGIHVAALVALAVGLLAGASFVRRQHVVADPLVDVGLFRSAAFGSAIGSMVAAVFLIDGTFLFLSQYLQLISGKTPLAAALWLLPATGGLVIGSLAAPLITHRVGAISLLVAGLVGAAGGVALFTQIDPANGLDALVAGSVLMGIGSGLVGTVATDVVVGAAPPDRAGAASAISETGAELGGALGIAVLGSVGLAVYHMQLNGKLPRSLTPAQHAAATRTLADATRTSAHLSHPASAEVFHAAAAAFTDGIHLVAATASAITVLLAVAAALALRRAPATAA
jgi:DHA2 family multidrug resistance protein-like MFS transporter